jgi:hypothetical protein
MKINPHPAHLKYSNTSLVVCRFLSVADRKCDASARQYGHVTAALDVFVFTNDF